MTKVVVAKIKLGKPSVTTKRVKNAAGKLTTIHEIDANSPTFASDLSYVFRKNVAKARRSKP